MIPNPREFFPLYTRLLETDMNGFGGDVVPFFCQAGSRYRESVPRILFVGKSVNGWVTSGRTVEELFDPRNPDRIVNRSDQMEWVKDLEGSQGYNTKKSAFWRTAKGVASALFGEAAWYQHVAWTNLYKVSPIVGNPSLSLRKRQLETCRTILELEIRALEPSVMVFLTSGWEAPLLERTPWENRGGHTLSWGHCQLTYADAAGRLVIHSLHPERKPEAGHVEAILKAIRGER